MLSRCPLQPRCFALLVSPVKMRVEQHLFFQGPRVRFVEVFNVVLHGRLCALSCFACRLAILAGGQLSVFSFCSCGHRVPFLVKNKGTHNVLRCHVILCPTSRDVKLSGSYLPSPKRCQVRSPHTKASTPRRQGLASCLPNHADIVWCLVRMAQRS